jgi:hypothetical protein
MRGGKPALASQRRRASARMAGRLKVRSGRMRTIAKGFRSDTVSIVYGGCPVNTKSINSAD